MSQFQITEVHLEWTPGSKHEHIARVRLLGHSQDYARSEIITAIRNGDVFYTYANPPALVYAIRCPTCVTGDYITTHPDDTTKNNLLDLPRY